MSRCRKHRRGEECEFCQTFVCAACKRRVGWDFGANDEFPGYCDDCWVASQAKEQR